ncbi:hypothetical protein QCA50_006827 [Cerrena zonata]|uniref:Histone deacetylase domain-containing protein n=1 Tax=Cerrena zonata TaxID=2478898 RepID=A0AAW0GBC4_9APHY
MSVTMGKSETSVFLQEACLQHRFIRSKDVSNIVERPERLRAVNVGLSAAIARLETVFSEENTVSPDAADELTAALNNLKLTPSGTSPQLPVKLIKSTAKAQLLDNQAVKFVHGDIDGDVYLENLIKWSKESRDRIAQDSTEIPQNLSQGDLYLCPESIDAIQGALGTTCEAVDSVLSDKDSKRAFVAIRPPGHHCGEDTPSGFCFVNNVAVAAAHAHIKHGIKRVVIFDIDLHHGNGTQSIAWQINEETYRETLEVEQGSQSAKPGPQIFYGSIHDVLSYPCEDGKPELVQAASVSLHGPHGQYIENIHLQTYKSNEEFWEKLYKPRYSKLLQKAENFIQETGGAGDDVLVFISAGFDANEHEHQSMQRHDRRVPASFYFQFARDASEFADRVSKGRLVSVLEGGYSDRALISGAMAHLCGLTLGEKEMKDVEDWWNIEKLEALEQATKKRRGGRPSLSTTPPEPWLQRTLDILAAIDCSPPPQKPVLPPSSRSLRERQNRSTSGKLPKTGKKTLLVTDESLGETSDNVLSDATSETLSPELGGTKKLPRVILKLGPGPPES